MRTEPVLILAGFAVSLAATVNGLLVAFLGDNLTELEVGALATAVSTVFALFAALLARGRVYSPQSVSGAWPVAPSTVGADKLQSVAADQRTEHEKLAAMASPERPPEITDGTLVDYPPAKTPRTSR